MGITRAIYISHIYTSIRYFNLAEAYVRPTRYACALHTEGTRRRQARRHCAAFVLARTQGRQWAGRCRQNTQLNTCTHVHMHRMYAFSISDSLFLRMAGSIQTLMQNKAHGTLSLLLCYRCASPTAHSHTHRHACTQDVLYTRTHYTTRTPHVCTPPVVSDTLYFLTTADEPSTLSPPLLKKPDAASNCCQDNLLSPGNLPHLRPPVQG